MSTQEKSVALSTDPQGGAGTGTPAPPVPSRCRLTLHDTKKPASEKRLRCIHPADHQGPHWFGDAS